MRLVIVHKKVGRTPWSARVPLDPLYDQPNQSGAIIEGPTGGSAADQGVRPTASKLSDIEVANRRCHRAGETL
jgi:hypothetical protein